MNDNTKIINFLKAHPEGATLSEIASRTGHGRATVGKYLEMLKLENKADYKGIGRAKVWFLTETKKPKILIVDDEPGLLRLLHLTLGDEDYMIIEASDGITALEKVNQHMPDLIILDLILPKIDGLGVCARLKENVLTRKIPVIMLTARDELNTRIKGIKLGADDYVTKPFDVLDLKERVKTFLHQARDRNSVTNLPNFSLMEEKINAKRQSGEDIGVIRVSFDHLDAYSELHGKLKENEFLKIVSQILVHCALPVKNNIVGHLSDREFIVVCAKNDLDKLSECIKSSVDEIIPFLYPKKNHSMIQIKLTIDS
jgi:two-component system, OmpR family, alkaline phosphatase synthesis response regulator PhoP